MDRQDIAKGVAKSADITIAQGYEAVDIVLSMIKTAVIAEGKIVLKGFGTFRTIETKERVGRNPRTGEEVIIPETIRVRFKASKDFLD